MANVQDKTTPAEPAQDELLAKLDAGFPSSWQAEKAGDTIVGAFLRLEQGQSAFGPSPIVVLGTPEGERSVWLFAESLKTGFLRAQPAPGERVAIRYEGEQPVKNPTPGRKQTAHIYRVAVDRPAQAAQPVDWGAALGGTSSSNAEPDGDDGIPY